MSRISVKNFYERMGAGQLRGDDPMDAGYCWNVVDNVSHLVDESYVYRLNFLLSASSSANSNFYIDKNGEQYGFEFYFHTTIARPNRYPRYDVRVALLSNDGTNQARASIVHPSVTWPVSPSGFGVIGTASATIPGTGDVEWVIDAAFDAADTTDAPITWVTSPFYPGAEGSSNMIARVKLIVEWPIEANEGGVNGMLRGIQVREYSE